jgi:hypothetical protein
MPVAALLKTANENFRQLERPSFSFFEALPDHQRFKSGERGYACRAPGICIEEMHLGGIRTNLLFTMSDITRATAEAAGANLFFQSGPVFAPWSHDAASANSPACRAEAPWREGWWSQTESNRRPHACKARALPTELWPH